MKILVIHGPNLNLLGTREKDVYGTDSYNTLNASIKDHAKTKGIDVDIYQSNHEGEIVDMIQKSEGYEFIIINPGAYTHYSLAIRDAIAGISVQVIEVHISNIYTREQFRAKSVISEVAVGQISGFGHHSYILALDAASYLFQKSSDN